MIQLLKVLHGDDPKRGIHGVGQATTNKGDDPCNKGPVQHLADLWVWESPAVAILRVHQTQKKHADERRHAMFVEGAPRFFPPFVHPPRVAVQWGHLRPCSPPQALFSAHIHLTG